MFKNAIFLLSTVFVSPFCGAQTPQSAGWPTYGGDAGGQRYSSAAQITRANVTGLRPAWVYHTHALESGNLSVSRSDFEATPILFAGSLYLSTPFDRIIALDPATGHERWTYDPAVPKNVMAANYTSRGVAAWQESAAVPPGTPCTQRIYVATLDARLIAVDAANGHPCEHFGKSGQVDLKANITPNPDHPYLFYGNTSPATVIGDVVVVGSAVGDNTAVNIESGAVRGFDARTGAQLWSWEPLPWASKQKMRTGAGNAWAVIAADPANGLVFVPTGSASPDFYGRLRPGDNRDANSIVALNAKTGKKVWAFQLVHHDVWDYDVAAEPLLFDYKGHIPAVAVAAKTGVVFVLNRLTGEPLIPVEERAVPGGGSEGEDLSATQPFTHLAMNPLVMDRANLAGHDAAGLKTCSDKLRNLRYDGIFTPPTVGGSLQYPGSLGGVNWSSMSFDPETGTLYSNVNGSAYEIRLVSQASQWFTMILLLTLILLILITGSLLRRRIYPGRRAVLLAAVVPLAWIFITVLRQHNTSSPDSIGEVSPNAGAPFRIYRRVLQDEQGRPCTPLPWGGTTALNLNTGEVLWHKPLGTLIPGQHTGTVNFGAAIVTAGGLLFTAATSEPLLRAIDKATGEEVWTGAIPVPAQSTPMTYVVDGKQYVVISAGGHGGLGTPLGDSVVAFALP